MLWEAQYGDFVNGAEIIIDQFIIAGLAKWRQTSRLTLLLPHGYEGSGPEHSSARLERFLALGAEGNIRVVYPTTPAQYFHLLRRQARHADLRPLIVMTPKSLLRLPEAASRPAELSRRSLRIGPGRPDVTDEAAAGITRVIICSGKVYYDLTGFRGARRASRSWPSFAPSGSTPSPPRTWSAVLARYPAVERVTWVQEEPRNMGARKFVLPKIRHLVPFRIPLGDISRPERSRPAEGYPAAHAGGAGADRPRGADQLGMPSPPPLLERYRALLAEPDDERFPISLGEGGTPLLHARRLGDELGLERLFLKFEGTNPTGSFKDRGMVLAVNRAVGRGAAAVVCASTGNTSASAAAYAAAAGLPCHVVLPAGKVARGKLAQAVAAGARLVMVDGNFDEALAAVRAARRGGSRGRRQLHQPRSHRRPADRGLRDRRCARRVARGGRPAGRQRGQHHRRLGRLLPLCRGRHRRRQGAGPRMLGFQAAGAAPIVNGAPVEEPETVATAIRIGNPASWAGAEAARDESGGVIEAVS